MNSLSTGTIQKNTIPNISKLRTSLYKDKDLIRHISIERLAQTGLGEETVVPSPVTFGIDGTLSELNDESGEYKSRIIAAASTSGVVNKNKKLFDYATSEQIWSENKEKDLLQMSLLELKTINETCKVAGESDLIIKDGPFWSVLKDLKNAFELYPECLELFSADDLNELVQNIINHNFVFVVKDYDSFDLRQFLNPVNKDYNHLLSKRVFDVLLNKNESFNEVDHQKKLFSKYSLLQASDKYDPAYLPYFNELASYANGIYKGLITKFETNESTLKIEFLDDNRFKTSKKSILKALSLEMLGIQKEPYATFFAEDFAKNEALKRFSLNNLDEKIGMEQEDFLHNLPYRVRT